MVPLNVSKAISTSMKSTPFLLTNPNFRFRKRWIPRRRLEEAKKVNSKLKDLVMDKQDSAGLFIAICESEKLVFTDKGNFVVAGKKSLKRRDRNNA